MSEKKITKREMFEAIKKVLKDEKQIAFIDRELELLAKKNSASKKPTATQIANEGIKLSIYNGMKENRLYTVSELQKEIPECEELSNQRVSALLRQMMSEGRIARTEEKRRAYFSKIMGVEV